MQCVVETPPAKRREIQWAVLQWGHSTVVPMCGGWRNPWWSFPTSPTVPVVPELLRVVTVAFMWAPPALRNHTVAYSEL